MFEWYESDTVVVLVGILCSMACALLGNFLVLRKQSMMGDAISHAVLPGLAMAFLLTGSRGSTVMFLGAAVVGVFTALFTSWLARWGKVESGASMGVVFTILFALGLVLIVQAADSIDLDPGCVLYGEIDQIALLEPVFFIGKIGIPQPALTCGFFWLLNRVMIIVFFKELLLSSFDPALGNTLGFSSGLINNIFMVLVACTVVAAFEVVGSILVIAMLVIPPAAAYLLTDRLGLMIALSQVLALLAAVLGYLGAAVLPPMIGFSGTSTAGMMAVAAGVLFAVAMLAGPQHGLVARLLRRFKLAMRILCEDVVGLIYKMEERGIAPQQAQVYQLLHRQLGCRNISLSIAAMGLRRRGMLVVRSGIFSLTESGTALASRIVRAHRLWETYLEKHLDQLDIDSPAHRLEHATSDEMTERLSQALQAPEKDPHGSRIPPKQV
jgi:manganese/zinc/iron transport system permease protein